MKDKILRQISDLKNEISTLHLLIIQNRVDDDSETSIWLSTNAIELLEEPLLRIEKQVKDLK